MKILLVQPKHIHHPDRAFEPINLGYLASYLKLKGYDDVSICIGAQSSDKEIINKSKNADLIGFTATSPMITHVEILVNLIKKQNPKATIITGGSHSSALPGTVLKNKNIDIVVRGEGEISLYEVVKSLEDFGDWERIDGISFRRNGKIIHNRSREQIKDLDQLPFPERSLLSQERFTKRYYRIYGKRSAWILSSRGCPFSCSYCASQVVWHRKWRARSAENVVKEICEIKEKYKLSRVDFADDTFTVNKKRVMEICNILVKNKIEIEWGCNVHSMTIDKEMLEAMKPAGCNEIWVGVESGSPEILKELKKGTNVNKIKDIFRITEKAGIARRAYLMIGAPSEDLNTIGETVKLIDEIRPDYIGHAILTPFPGCELYSRAKAKGFLNDETDWSAVDLDNATMPTDHLSLDELNREYQRLGKKISLLEKKKKFSILYLLYKSRLELKENGLKDIKFILSKLWRYLELTILYRKM